MSTNLRSAFQSAGINRSAFPSLPAQNAGRNSGKKYTKPADGHIVIPYHKLRDGSVFVPIEKMGRKFYRKVTDRKTGRVHHVGERTWAVTKDLFIKDSNARSMSLTTGKDAIFSLHDWCIVRVS